MHLTRPKFQDGRDQPPKGPGELHDGQSGGCAAGQELPASQEPQSPYLQYSFLNSGNQGNRWVAALCPSIVRTNTRRTSGRMTPGFLQQSGGRGLLPVGLAGAF